MFGQYSAGGGANRTKVEMVEIFEGQGYHIDPAQARKGGKNRLHFICERTGLECFTLHETVVATFDRKAMRITLADGGWPTPTTKTAWSDAINAFKLTPSADKFERDNWWEEAGHDPAQWHGERDADGFAGYLRKGYVHIGRPTRDERSVTYKPGDEIGHWVRAEDATQDAPMLRADTDSGNFAVRFDGRNLNSDAGVVERVSPFKMLCTLYYADKLAREGKDYRTLRGSALYQFSFQFRDYGIHLGQSAREIMVGCHTFRTVDVRSFMRAIEARHPDVVKPAKAFVRKHPKDFGFKAYEASRGDRRLVA